MVRALNEGLRDLGYVEGRNLVFERRYADGRLERLPDLAAELVRLRVDVIVTGTNIQIAAAQRATVCGWSGSRLWRRIGEPDRLR
jgi:putative ABC transport system substrate-binding protein